MYSPIRRNTMNNEPQRFRQRVFVGCKKERKIVLLLLFSIFLHPTKILCRQRLCWIVPCFSSYRWVHFSRAVLLCQPHQQLFTHSLQRWQLVTWRGEKRTFVCFRFELASQDPAFYFTSYAVVSGPSFLLYFLRRCVRISFYFTSYAVVSGPSFYFTSYAVVSGPSFLLYFYCCRIGLLETVTSIAVVLDC